MKKLFLLLFVAVCINANAQTENKKVVDNALPKHDIRLEMGESMRMFKLYDEDIVDDMSPTFSTSYHNRILKWLWMGAAISYNQKASVTYRLFSDDDLVYLNDFRTLHQLSFAPSVRFSYFDKYNLFMYSGVQFGMCWQKDPMLYSGKSGGVNYIGMFGQLTLFGITYGKDFYLGGEIGFGNKGLFNFTAGYRF